jgi:hypothetical protein
MNDEITHAFGGIVGNGVYVCEGDKVVGRGGRVTSNDPRDITDIPDLITSGEAP